MNSQHTIKNLTGHFVVEKKNILKDRFKDFRYTNINQTQILYDLINFFPTTYILNLINVIHQTKSDSKIYISLVSFDVKYI